MGSCGPCFSMMPKGSRQVPCACAMAWSKSFAVNSSQRTGSFDCARAANAQRKSAAKPTVTAFFMEASFESKRAYENPRMSYHDFRQASAARGLKVKRRELKPGEWGCRGSLGWDVR